MEKRPITTDESKDGELVPDNQNAIEPAIEAILEAVPEDKKTEVIKAISIVQQEVFSGPIPHPRLLAEYERLLPGSMDRFMKMAEQQQNHRIDLEEKAVASQLKSNERGQVFGFILSALVIISGIVLFVIGMPWFGIPIIVGMVAVLVVLFVRGKIHMEGDLKNKKASVDAQSK